jgi:hypothetical protein
MSGQNVTALKIVTGVIEMGAGAALLAVPSVSATLLFGESLESQVALSMARFSGAGLLALGIACWMARFDPHSPTCLGLVAAMLFYYIVVVGVLVFANLSLGLHGSALWPVIAIHAAMSAWCIIAISLRWPAPNVK